MCPPYPYQPGCFPYPYAQFYDPTTGIATVPPNGSGRYALIAGLQTDSANTATAEIQINGTAVATGTLGTTPGNLTTVLAAFHLMSPGQQIKVVIRDDIGSANVIAGANSYIKFVRIGAC